MATLYFSYKSAPDAATVRANDALGFGFEFVVVDKRFGLVSDEESFRDLFMVDDDDEDASNDKSRNRLSDRMDDRVVPIGGLLRSMLLRVVLVVVVVNDDDVLLADGLMVVDMLEVYRVVLTPDLWLDAADES